MPLSPTGLGSGIDKDRPASPTGRLASVATANQRLLEGAPGFSLTATLLRTTKGTGHSRPRW